MSQKSSAVSRITIDLWMDAEAFLCSAGWRLQSWWKCPFLGRYYARSARRASRFWMPWKSLQENYSPAPCRYDSGVTGWHHSILRTFFPARWNLIGWVSRISKVVLGTSGKKCVLVRNRFFYFWTSRKPQKIAKPLPC